MELEGSLSCSLKYAIGPYDSLFVSTVQFYTSSTIHFNIILPSRRWSVKPNFVFNVFRQEIVYIFFYFLPSARPAHLPLCNEIIDYEVLH